MMRIAISGANGRMGRMLIEAVLNHPDLRLTVALVPEDSDCLGEDAGRFLGKQTGVLLSSDLSLLANADCLIDFTRPEGTLSYLQACQQINTKMVIGTTGFNEAQKKAIEDAAKHIAIVFSPNMSVGVHATLKLLAMAAQLLSDNYDVEILESHHRHKVDAPSGTALMMGNTIAEAWGQSLTDIADWARHGHTGERENGKIGFSVIRGGDIVGEHTVLFCGAGERIEITHRSSSRVSYAQGSCKAALFLQDKDKGLYDMPDVMK